LHNILTTIYIVVCTRHNVSILQNNPDVVEQTNIPVIDLLPLSRQWVSLLYFILPVIGGWACYTPCDWWVSILYSCLDSLPFGAESSGNTQPALHQLPCGLQRRQLGAALVSRPGRTVAHCTRSATKQQYQGQNLRQLCRWPTTVHQHTVGTSQTTGGYMYLLLVTE